MYRKLTDSTDYIFLVLLDDLVHLENRVMLKPGAKRGAGGRGGGAVLHIPFLAKDFYKLSLLCPSLLLKGLLRTYLMNGNEKKE